MALLDVVNKPLTVQIKGREYNIKRLTLNDYAELEKKIRQERIKLASAARDSMPKEEFMAFLKEAMTSPISVFEEATTLSGIKFLLWRALKDNQGITEEQIDEIVDFDNLTEILTLLTGGKVGEEEVPFEEKSESSQT